VDAESGLSYAWLADLLGEWIDATASDLLPPQPAGWSIPRWLRCSPRPVSSAGRYRRFRMNRRQRVANAIGGVLARAGIGPIQLLTTCGRKTGLPRAPTRSRLSNTTTTAGSSPRTAPFRGYTTRHAGVVTIRHGRDTRDYIIRERRPAEAGPVLERVHVGAGPGRY
jgi:hypothetical protein